MTAMNFLKLVLALFSILSTTTSSLFAEDLPRALDDRLKITLFAEQPEIVTPTGIDVDQYGNVWAIESNTHFPPPGYPGHPTDRVLVFTDQDGDGKADEKILFTDGLVHTMSVAVMPVWLNPDTSKPVAENPDQSQNPESDKPVTRVYLATRKNIFLMTDVDGDFKADQKKQLIHLETTNAYPHNALAGFAFDAQGWLYFGFGENHGAAYTLTGSDGITLTGSDEGGNVYRCRPDGSQLRLWSTGFWNPHASCVDAFGSLFTVDNDPDSKPPCRLLHVIAGGDYGYRWRNGRKGLHPFTSWNGELPGTLPMVAGTGEAPSGIVAYEADAFPADYIGNLLVTSWGDHRIDRFVLKKQGASFRSLAKPVIQGGVDFRPVGLAVAPDGSLYCTDWVKRDYKLHGFGRIWKIEAVESAHQPEPTAEQVANSTSLAVLRKAIRSPQLPIRRTAARRLVAISPRQLVNITRSDKYSERSHYEAIEALVSTVLSKELDLQRILKSYSVRLDGPYDAAQTSLMNFFDHRPAITNLLTLLQNPQETDPNYLLSGMEGLTPLIITLGHSQSRVSVLLLNKMSEIDDPFLYLRLVQLLAEQLDSIQLEKTFQSDAKLSVPLRLAVMLAARRQNPKSEELVKAALSHPALAIRRAAAQWAGEAQLKNLRPEVAALLESKEINSQLFLATLAALELLDGVPSADFDKTPADKYILPLLKDDQRPIAVRIQALRLADPNDAELTSDFLQSLAKRDHPELKLEVVRLLQLRKDESAEAWLRELAADEDTDIRLRTAAVTALANNRTAEQTQKLLVQMLAHSDQSLKREALRAVRALETSNKTLHERLQTYLDKLSQIDPEWKQATELARAGKLNWYDPATEPASVAQGHGDAQAGRRLFFNAQGAGCFQCHKVNGRGGRIGPDLSTIARTMNRAKLAESLLDPSREIAPQFTLWTFLTQEGKTYSGMIVHENRGKTVVGDAQGKLTELETIDIELRQEQQKSVMPDNLAERMTRQELLDLLSFLETCR